MTKLTFRSLWAALAIITMALTATSCGHDSDDGNTPDNPSSAERTLATYVCKYEVKLSPAWYDFFTIEVEYSFGDSDGVRRETLTADKTYTQSVEGNPSGDFIFNVTAIPRADHAEVAEGEVYRFTQETLNIVTGTYTDGSRATIAGGNTAHIDGFSLGGNGLTAYMAKEHKITSFTSSYPAK